MATATIRRTPHALLALPIVILAGCAHAPSRPAGPAVINSPLGTFPVAVSGAHSAQGTPAIPTPASQPPAAPVSTEASASSPPAEVAGTAPPTAPAAVAAQAAPSAVSGGPTQVAGLNPAQYADLFDRMRAGFRLEDESEHHAVDQQLRWYAANPDYLERAFARADLYLYHIVTELERRGMPEELALLPVVESAFEPYAYSRARASGLWQFISDTGSRYGLKQDWWYDGRRDIVESTRAALDYLQALHDEFDGDWLLAIAAYNCGEALVERAVEMNRAAGRPVDFWNLWLPRETRAYVPKLLAMKRLVLDPEAFGLVFSPIPNQPYFTPVPTDGQINLKLAAEIAGISPEELYELNPAFHRWATDPTGPHVLLLPVDAADVFAENVTQLSIDQRLGVTHYAVSRGDSIASVAKQFHTTVNVIRELNDMPTRGLAMGDDLRVPSAVTELPAKVMLAAAQVDGKVRATRPHVQIVRRGDSLWTIARRTGVNVNTLALMNGLQPDDPLRAGQRIRISAGSDHHVSHRHITYTVRDGDTMAQIAQLFQCSVPQLLAWNGLSPHARIHTGQKLRIHLGMRHS
ncbi:MAG TPA: LysM peptidoglycan-binding domain-containing protein [Steroidobacteraceae bacterium]|nr:LysM peptidoglycan-binding domain-containing protein [Steroidobacteraceae bacterium]